MSRVLAETNHLYDGICIDDGISIITRLKQIPPPEKEGWYYGRPFEWWNHPNLKCLIVKVDAGLRVECHGGYRVLSEYKWYGEVPMPEVEND